MHSSSPRWGRYLESLGQNVEKTAARLAWAGGERTIQGGQIASERRTGAGAAFQLTNTGQTPIYVNVIASGIPADAGTSPTQQGVTLKRRMLDRSGNEVQPAALRQGETYVVEWTIAAERDLENFVISDLLPAGLEVDNPPACTRKP